jgi:mannose-6-phosphate isomerase-like protein (cupin superfamily)
MVSLETDTYHVLGNIIRFRLRSSETGGAFSLVEARTRPGAGAPPNRHAADREAFLVVSGRYEFDLDGRVEVHGPGALVRVPDGKPHSFRNVGEEDSAMMIMTWPGRGHDEFFATVGEPLLSGETRFPEGGPPPDIPAIVEAAKRCGIELLLPA